MTAEPILTLAWLALAHLTADFVLQTNRIATDKFATGRRALRALGAHVGIVGLCLVPAIFVWGGPGLAFALAVTGGHAVIDRAKIVSTRRLEAGALARARRTGESPATADGLGPAWTSAPAALFVLDQLAHLAVGGLAWAVWLAGAPLDAGWTSAATSLLSGWDPVLVHRVVLVLVVAVDLAIVNVRAASLFVATLVSPRHAIGDEAIGDGSLGDEAAAGERPVPRIGATIGVLERLLIVVLILTGAEVAIGLVIAAKTLARFRQLDDRAFAEYYLLGTLASVSVALASGLIGLAALR
jgi:hypothetical protein